ncbi:lactonase family protein [Micromonospora avicenniae]|uniref:Lactonase, 7-bladed beta-propeller n=1 Tax=Micromonospora avicenniae TaxID=1198245 RepID=A0A1N7FUU3_9ACTN|nr:lactonase family protein [Micromonospora avicenniae]SIS04047.1 hypothetical protein SAMN05444858_1504 [Micromonospora avicenniae]
MFVQTDEPGGNRVIACDSHLHQVGAYATGGKGGVLGGAVADHLGSQGSLTLDRGHHLLYAVNAGSNTITVFRARGARLTCLQVRGSGGEFPVSVTVHGHHVYVLNARGGGSIHGFRPRRVRVLRHGTSGRWISSSRALWMTAFGKWLDLAANQRPPSGAWRGN